MGVSVQRLTRLELQRKLLRGEKVTWRDASGHPRYLELSDSSQRRLFEFLLASHVREPTNLPQEFVNGLAAAFRASSAPDQPTTAASTADPSVSVPWRLCSIKTEGFGGLNTWQGDPFHFDLDSESFILEGPNGSGKSSLVAAIIWGLTGERPRDQASSMPHEPQPVYSNKNTKIGTWPPIASYPDSLAGIKSPPRVCVELTFEAPSGARAKASRTLDAKGISEYRDPSIDIPPILIETGLLMPSRLGQLRLKGDERLLTAAVQQLTGFDDLVAIGKLVEGICHQSREYRTYKKTELSNSKQRFDQAVAAARTALAPIEEEVEAFVPADTRDDRGRLALFAKGLKDRDQEIAQVISEDLVDDLDPSDPQGNRTVTSAINRAQEALEAGLDGLPTWRDLCSIGDSFDPSATDRLRKAIDVARKDIKKALEAFAAQTKDSKYQLKAVGAKWHEDHIGGPVENCPLCDQTLVGKESLAQELEMLRVADDDASRNFDDSMNAIQSALDQATPVEVKALAPKTLKLICPRSRLVQDLRDQFILGRDYSSCLKRFRAIVETALSAVPAIEAPPSHESTGHVERIPTKVNKRIEDCERLLVLARWFQANSQEWRDWWESLVGLNGNQPVESDGEDADRSREPDQESLSAHLLRLQEALAKARPFHDAVKAMRLAWREGKNADKIQQEVDRRKEIAESLAELKKLRGLCESLAREAIEGLSNRIKAIMGELHLEGNLHFQNARLERREGLAVLGALPGDVRIDATQIANTSWVRAFLWAFLFALREEAVENLGSDRLPMLVVDDPQMTFDVHHRAMWADYVKTLQEPPRKVQLILTTHDEGFLDMIKVDGVSGREAVIAAPSTNINHAQVLEGCRLERLWESAVSDRTQEAWRQYIASVRVFVEGMLKQLLRGQDEDIDRLSLGKLRNRLDDRKGQAPWDQPAFRRLVGALDAGRAEVQYLNGAHHTTMRNFGWGEAKRVEEFWRGTLGPALQRAFRTTREHRLVHRGLSALYGGPAVAPLPDGKIDKVREIPLEVYGRASALTDGRVADGMLQMDHFDKNGSESVVLGNHSAYRLAADTLEPVARPGEIVLVHNHKDPTPRSLVVAISEDKLLARRFEIADNHADVAVLTSQSINPRHIEAPVIAHRSSFELRKIVGVLYERDVQPTSVGKEVVDCGGEDAIRQFARRSLGLVAVDGKSAEPYALDGQHLIVAEQISLDNGALRSYDGAPVIARDSGGSYYFKRLRTVDDRVVLESLDSGGVYRPVVLHPPNGGSPRLEQVWPVLGVLFEFET